MKDYSAEIDLFIGLFPQRTKTTYAGCIKRLLTFMSDIGMTDMELMTLEKLELFKANLERDYSPKTANMTIICVKSLYEFFMDRGVIRSNQTGIVKPTQVSSREQKTEYLNDAEVKRLLKTVYAIEDDNKRNSNKVMILLMLNAGLRKDEISNLKPSDIIIQNGKTILKVIGKGMRHRMIALSDGVAIEVNNAIKDLGIRHDQYVITGYSTNGNSNIDKPMNPSSIMLRVQQLAKAAHIRKEITPHSLRRTCATMMYSKEVPIEVIQRILGHESVSTTQRYIAMEADIEMSSKHALEIA